MMGNKLSDAQEEVLRRLVAGVIPENQPLSEETTSVDALMRRDLVRHQVYASGTVRYFATADGRRWVEDADSSAPKETTDHE